jgi:hypothetical protein
MRLTTWSGSVIETQHRHWSVWYLWALGWVRYSVKQYILDPWRNPKTPPRAGK